MDFIKFLISYFMNGNDTETDTDGLDLSSVLSSLTGGNSTFNVEGLTKIIPFLTSFLKNNKKSGSDFSEPQKALSPIVNFADKDIVYSLTKYFGSV